MPSCFQLGQMGKITLVNKFSFFFFFLFQILIQYSNKTCTYYHVPTTSIEKFPLPVSLAMFPDTGTIMHNVEERTRTESKDCIQIHECALEGEMEDEQYQSGMDKTWRLPKVCPLTLIV